MEKFFFAHRAILLRIMGVTMIALSLLALQAYVVDQRFTSTKYSFENERGIPIAGLKLTRLDVVKSYFHPVDTQIKRLATISENNSEENRFYNVTPTANGILIECWYVHHGIMNTQEYEHDTAGGEVVAFVLFTLILFLFVWGAVSLLLNPLGTFEALNKWGQREITWKMFIPKFIVFKKQVVQ